MAETTATTAQRITSVLFKRMMLKARLGYVRQPRGTNQSDICVLNLVQVESVLVLIKLHFIDHGAMAPPYFTVDEYIFVTPELIETKINDIMGDFVPLWRNDQAIQTIGLDDEDLLPAHHDLLPHYAVLLNELRHKIAEDKNDPIRSQGVSSDALIETYKRFLQFLEDRRDDWARLGMK